MKSKILLVVCVSYFMFGLKSYNYPPIHLDTVRRIEPGITAHTDMFSLHEIGLLFMVVSVLAAILVSLRKTDLGYALMTFLLTWWALMYLVSWYQTGQWHSVYGATDYGLTAILLTLCSKIVEFPKGMRESQNTPLPLSDLDTFLHENIKKREDSG